MRATKTIAMLALLLLLAAACGPRPLVVQGEVVAHDPEARTLTLRNEQPPAEEMTLSLEGAEIGAPPEPGDLVRVAYHLRDGRMTATRVMNLTRQKELAGGGH